MSNTGEKVYKLAEKIFPICRSITGSGVKATLKVLSAYISQGTDINMQITNVPSGTDVFDWTVPREWVIREAYIEDENYNRIVDFKINNLHVMGYSTSVDRWVGLDELLDHIITLPDQPLWIPYATSYYHENYGFCMSEEQKNTLKPGKYHMFIDSEHIDGNLTFGEVVLPGATEKEIFFSTYICHPSMADNECSGPALTAELIRYVSKMPDRKYTYRFIFVPETIGSITYLATANHLEHLQTSMIAGFNISCVGDNRDYSMVETPYGDTLADEVLKNVLTVKEHYSIWPYLKRGSDERQYCAPRVGLPVVCFCRSKFGAYPEYHTSADNMDLISPEGFAGSYEVLTDVIRILEKNNKYCVTVFCEPQLGKRGLYPTASKKGIYDELMDMENFLAYADGRNDLLDISRLIRVPVKNLLPVAELLLDKGLIKNCGSGKEKNGVM